MSLFNDPVYDYWQSHFLYIWSIKNVNIEPRLISIFDSRATALFSISRYLSINPQVQININDFDYVPASYNDLVAFVYIANEYLGNKFNIVNRNIIYIP